MCAVTGLLLAIGIASARRPLSPPPAIVEDIATANWDATPLTDIERCRSVTEPDEACARAWDELNRRFFMRRKRKP